MSAFHCCYYSSFGVDMFFFETFLFCYYVLFFISTKPLIFKEPRLFLELPHLDLGSLYPGGITYHHLLSFCKLIIRSNISIKFRLNYIFTCSLLPRILPGWCCLLPVTSVRRPVLSGYPSLIDNKID